MPRSEQSIASIIAVLAITQLIGWGTMSLPAVIGEQLARDLGLSLPAVFAGTTVMLVVTGVVTSLMANAFVIYGARLMMAAGSLVAAPGFWLMALANGPVLYYAAWIVLGIAGGAMLSTATYILLNEVAGGAAKRPIGALMLMTGLSSSIFWPITAALTGQIGWRATVAIYGVAMVLVCFPLHRFALPARRKPAPHDPGAAAAGRVPPVRGGLTFPLLVGAMTLHTFVGWGFVSTIIQLLKSLGVADDVALRAGSLLGVVQMSARAIDFFGGARWSGLVTAVVAAIITPIGFLALLIGGSGGWAICAFMLFYGLGSGAMAVARATMPLVFYEAAEFTRVSSYIALPTNLAAAAAPPILVAVLISYGGQAVLIVTLASSLCGLVMLLGLVHIHRKAREVG